MKKITKKIIVLFTVLFVNSLTSCMIDIEDGHDCWLADPDLSCRYDKVNYTYTLGENESRNIVLCWAGHCIPVQASCSFNGGDLVDVSPKNEDNRFTQFTIAPYIKEGVNTFDVYYKDKHQHFEILVRKK